MSTSASGSFSFSIFTNITTPKHLLSSYFSSALAGALPTGAIVAAGAAAADPMLESKSSMLRPFIALVNKVGRYGSTSFPLALMILISFSLYTSNQTVKERYCDFEFTVLQ